MMKDLPEATQRQVVDHLREYVEDHRHETRWVASVVATRPQLASAARRAKEEIAAGQAIPLDLNSL